jgi:hypothetical protein
LPVVNNLTNLYQIFLPRVTAPIEEGLGTSITTINSVGSGYDSPSRTITLALSDGRTVKYRDQAQADWLIVKFLAGI